MDYSLKELTEMTFKKSDNVTISDLSLDLKMLNIYWAMDGSRDLKTVARDDAYDLEELAANVQNLLKIGALEANQVMLRSVDSTTLDMLSQNLAKALGPVADMLIEKTISTMGYTLSSLPNNKLKQVIDQLALEIRDDQSSKNFKNSMTHFIEASLQTDE